MDSVLFEPNKWLQIEHTTVAPKMVPTRHPDLLASPYGLLMNEIVHSPFTIFNCVENLLISSLALDTGSVAQYKSEEFTPAVDIILYVARIGARVENFGCYLLDLKEDNGSINNPLRGVAMNGMFKIEKNEM